MQQETKRTNVAGITFAVSDVKRATKPLPEKSYADALAETLGLGGVASPLESYSRNTKPLVSTLFRYAHTFMHAVNLAYDEHRPLVLSPDMIWLLIAQGVAMHINANAEALRHRFVAHEGKAKITVQRDEFVRGFAGNDWEGVFTEFAEQIRAHIGEQGHERIVRRFSTTGIVEQAAFEVTLMDACQTYLDFRLLTRCGIPEITLEGTPQDWRSIRASAEALVAYDLVWWTEHLLPVLDQFIAASEGDIDLLFWRSFYKLHKQSGGPYINGHVINLFPYLVDGPLMPDNAKNAIDRIKRQPGLSVEDMQARVDEISQKNSEPYRNHCLGWRESAVAGVSANSYSDRFSPKGILSPYLPTALSVAPFTWQYYDQQIPMEFVAGFVGVAQDPDTLAVRPEIGWAVRERQGVNAEVPE